MTGMYLHSHDVKYKHPIAGQQEVTCVSKKSAACRWATEVRGLDPLARLAALFPLLGRPNHMLTGILHRRGSISRRERARTTRGTRKPNRSLQDRPIKRATPDDIWWQWVARQEAEEAWKKIVTLIKLWTWSRDKNEG